MNGPDLRDEGMERAERGQDVWRAMAWNELILQAGTDRLITAATITNVVGLPGRRNAIGALFSNAKRAGLIIEVGFEQATRASRHASRQLVWRGVLEGVEAATPLVSAPSRAPLFGDINLIRAMRR